MNKQFFICFLLRGKGQDVGFCVCVCVASYDDTLIVTVICNRFVQVKYKCEDDNIANIDILFPLLLGHMSIYSSPLGPNGVNQYMGSPFAI